MKYVRKAESRKIRLNHLKMGLGIIRTLTTSITTPMALIIKKFGGTSVADVRKICAIATIVSSALKQGDQVVVVVSAMAGVTNHLVSLCNEISSLNVDSKKSELDTALSSGEIVTSALTALSLQEQGIDARSLLAWQIGITTNAHYNNAIVQKIDTNILNFYLEQNIVPVIAGFQGIYDNVHEKRCTTLGRGGSDTTASLIAAALQADRCDIYSDVEGVFTADPRIVPHAKKIDHISTEEMLELSSFGAKVLHPRAIEIAIRYGISIHVLSSFNLTQDRSPLNGTLITARNNNQLERGMEHIAIKSITYNKNLLSVQMHKKHFDNMSFDTLLLEAGIIVDWFTVLNDCVHVITALSYQNTIKHLLSEINVDFIIKTDIAFVSIVGYGIKNNPQFISRALKLLHNKSIPVLQLQVLEMRASILMQEHHVDQAVRTLHTLVE